MNSLPPTSPWGPSGTYSANEVDTWSKTAVGVGVLAVGEAGGEELGVLGGPVEQVVVDGDGVPSDQTASSVMVYLTVSGSSEVTSIVPKSLFSQMVPSVPK